jgi:hypothetical protein
MKRTLALLVLIPMVAFSQEPEPTPEPSPEPPPSEPIPEPSQEARLIAVFLGVYLVSLTRHGWRYYV